jgi:[methyl-Co(III) methanol-specific corrinoid protein]:coenzyme M methyltransferase
MGEVRHRERVLGILYGKLSKDIPVICANQTGTVEVMEKVEVFWPDAHVDPEKMAKLALAGHTVLRFESVRVPFDQTVEAEALGAEIRMGKRHEFPEVINPLSETPPQSKFPDDFVERGRIPTVLEAIKKLRAEVGDKVPIIAGIVGPFSVSAQAFGLERFLKWTIRDVDGVLTALSEVTPLIKEYAELQVKCGADIISIEEMAASPDMLNPKFFERHVAPRLREIIDEVDVPVILHICGNATRILPKMVEMRPAAISLDARTDLNKAREVAQGKVKLVGNLSPVHTLLHKDTDVIKQAVKDVIENGIDMVAPGCSLSPLTPTENIWTMVESAREFESLRHVPEYVPTGKVEGIYVNYSLVTKEQPTLEDIVEERLPSEETLKELALAVVKGDQEKVGELTRRALESHPPADVIQNSLVIGMNIVGKLWEVGEYYIPEVIQAADAMQVGIKICEEKMGKGMEKKGKAVIFVAEGDIHDLGKNLVVTFLKANGYEVVDLGKDVETKKVIDVVMKEKPLILCGSALMTTTMSAFPKIAKSLIDNGVTLPFAVGGGAVTREFAESFPLGIYGEKAHHAVKIAELARKGLSWEEIRRKIKGMVS